MAEARRKMDDVKKSAGDSFEFWKRQVDRAYVARLGMGSDDLGDAQWYDMWEGDMSPLDGMAHALVDWQELPAEITLDSLGLGGRV